MALRETGNPAENPGGSEDAQLRQRLEDWCNGDQGAIQELLVGELDWLRSKVRARMGDAIRDRMDSMDMVQELAMDALHYSPRFVVSNRAQFRALLARMVENNLRDARRFHDRRGLGQGAGSLHDSILDLDGSGGNAHPPDEAATQDDMREWLQLALEFLPDIDRRLVRGREFSGKSFEELGVELDLQANTARMRFHRALAKLAGHIRELRQGRIESLFLE